MCQGRETWKGVIERNDLPDVNWSGVVLMDFCAVHRLSIINTMLEHSCTWHQFT